MAEKLQRRVAGYNDLRLDGMGDLLCRARGASVLDIGCNRGLIAYEFAVNGAAVVHGVDSYEPGIAFARELFIDLRNVTSRFEVWDARSGRLPMGDRWQYDITLLIATYHKLKRVMPAEDLSALMRHIGDHTKRYFAWRGTSDKPDENDEEMAALDVDMDAAGLVRVHTSRLSRELDICAVWERR
jgi:SAM-dependent methyltransferase